MDCLLGSLAENNTIFIRLFFVPWFSIKGNWHILKRGNVLNQTFILICGAIVNIMKHLEYTSTANMLKKKY